MLRWPPLKKKKKLSKKELRQLFEASKRNTCIEMSYDLSEYGEYNV